MVFDPNGRALLARDGQAWADLEEMRDAGTLDIATVAGVLVHHLGADDERIARLRSLAS